jgi:hypothetical protein
MRRQWIHRPTLSISSRLFGTGNLCDNSSHSHSLPVHPNYVENEKDVDMRCDMDHANHHKPHPDYRG